MNTLEFLEILNEDFVNVEKKVVEALEKEGIDEQYPNIFILGLPRSGTTLLCQLIFYNMDVLCTNNLIAKFWKTPLVGCMLSKLVIGETKMENYTSSFGVTQYPWEPHEFSWFWHDILNIKGIEEGPPNIDVKDTIDWNRVKKKILGINLILEAPVVHKPLELVGYYLQKFVALFKKGLFIFIERDLLEIACSLAKARLKKYGSLDKWWGSYPPYEKFLLIKDQPWYVQITGQVWFLWEMYKEKLTLIPKTKLVIISYKELCKNPKVLLEEIEYKSDKLGYKIKITKSPPERFEYRTSFDQDLIKYLKKGFEIVQRGM